jgi:hypothetical protein
MYEFTMVQAHPANLAHDLAAGPYEGWSRCVQKLNKMLFLNIPSIFKLIAPVF